MAWTQLGLVLYLFAIINFVYAFYNVLQSDLIGAIASLVTSLVLLAASANIEEAV